MGSLFMQYRVKSTRGLGKRCKLPAEPRPKTNLSVYSSIRPPSHSDEDHEDRTALRPKILDERSRDVVKMQKCSVFKFILGLRLYYVLARFSQHLTRSH